MPAMGRHRPTRQNYSFRVERDLILIYLDSYGYAHESIRPAGEIIWHTESRNGFVFFVDMNGNVGRFRSHTYTTLVDSGYIFLTRDWISWEQAHRLRKEYCVTDIADVGDALDRIHKT